MTALDEVTENFREQFHQLSDSDLSRLTMRKQCLSETANFHVLFQDLAFVLEMLQGAIEHANKTDTSIVLVATLTRFGQKQDFLLPLGFLRREEVHAVTLHYACSIAPKGPKPERVLVTTFKTLSGPPATCLPFLACMKR